MQGNKVVGTTLGLAVTLALVNWLFVRLFHWPVLYCAGWLVPPILPLLNLALVVLLIFSLVWEGLWRGLQVAVVMIGLNMLPNIFTAVFNLGGRC